MQIFEANGLILGECVDEKDYYRAFVVSGGYAHGEGFYATLQPHGFDELTFKIVDPSVYDKVLSSYLTKQEVGLVLSKYVGSIASGR